MADETKGREGQGEGDPKGQGGAVSGQTGAEEGKGEGAGASSGALSALVGAEGRDPVAGMDASLFGGGAGSKRENGQDGQKGEQGGKGEEGVKGEKGGKGAEGEKGGKGEGGAASSGAVSPQGAEETAEEWPEGYEFQVGRDHLVVGKDITRAAANEIRRGRRALGEAAKVRTALEHTEAELRTARAGQMGSSTAAGAGTTAEAAGGTTGSGPARNAAGQFTSGQGAADPGAGAGRASGAGTGAAKVAAGGEAGLSADKTELLAGLKAELSEEFGDERAGDVAQGIQTLVEKAVARATAPLQAQNETLSRELAALKPEVEKHGRAVSAVSAGQQKAQQLEVFERYHDENPRLREIGSTADQFGEDFRENQRMMIEAGCGEDEILSRAGQLASLRYAEGRARERYIEGMQARRAGGERSPGGRASKTSPGGAAPAQSGFSAIEDDNSRAFRVLEKRS
jgi:hypothetical protein